MNYNPLIEPDPKEWLLNDELERFQWIIEYHKRAKIKLPNVEIHGIVHLIVENQAALGNETPVAQTLKRLIEEGLDRHEAVHAVGSVLVQYIMDILHGKKRKKSPKPTLMQYVA
jgi:hypothetical protein